MTKRYEFVFVIKGSLDSKEKEKTQSSLEKEIKKLGGKIKKKDNWGKRKLAYPIKKEEEGDYYLWQLSFSPAPRLNEFNIFLNRNENIIRYLFLKLKKKDLKKVK